jgi:hypothetical protein
MAYAVLPSSSIYGLHAKIRHAVLELWPFQLGSARRGLKPVTVHVLLCITAILLNPLAALRLNRPEKARSITMLAR